MTIKDKIEYSVVVPIYNEQGNILKLDKEIREVLRKISKCFEIIYINDASIDNSLEELKSLKNTTIANMNRNYGQATALQVGFRLARGKIVISMDGDGQNDPKDIPKMLRVMKVGKYDVVAGWRKKRADKNGIKVLTRIGRALRKFLIKDNVHDTGCTLRVYKKDVVKTLDIGGEMHRYILALLRWKGFRIGETIVNDRKRENGVSKYGYTKALRGFIDLLYIWFIQKYHQRPLHIYGYLSATSFLLGLLTFGISIYGRIFQQLSLNRSGWFFLGIFFLLASIMFFSFGILLDIVLKIYLNTSPQDKKYYVRSVRRQ